MTTIAILGGLAILTLWGAIAPRGQWRVLAGWTRSRPYASEPGPVSVGVHRFVAILATVALVFGGYLLYAQYERSLPQPPKPISALQKMWGAPAPMVVDRVIQSKPIPTGLVAQPILHYQALDGSERSPDYLFDLARWKPVDSAGIVGATPPPGLSALDSASIVVQVRGDKNCIPRSASVAENATSLTIGIYYGRPDVAGSAPANVADCTPAPTGPDSVSVLIPLQLQGPVDKRMVKDTAGTTIPAVPNLIP
jgi:hypothetical protein